MKAKEEYRVRLEMAEMHEEFIESMSEAYDSGRYIESVWYCYSIFEQRISRLISKYIDSCYVKKERTDDSSAAISIRIICIRKMITAKYGAFADFDIELLDKVKEWCKKRNVLVHALVSLNNYKKYDDEFKQLAKTGVPLVFKLYDECTDFRNRWYETGETKGEFPQKNCKCKDYKCINPKCI